MNESSYAAAADASSVAAKSVLENMRSSSMSRLRARCAGGEHGRRGNEGAAAQQHALVRPQRRLLLRLGRLLSLRYLGRPPRCLFSPQHLSVAVALLGCAPFRSQQGSTRAHVNAPAKSGCRSSFVLLMHFRISLSFSTRMRRTARTLRKPTMPVAMSPPFFRFSKGVYTCRNAHKINMQPMANAAALAAHHMHGGQLAALDGVAL